MFLIHSPNVSLHKIYAAWKTHFLGQNKCVKKVSLVQILPILWVRHSLQARTMSWIIFTSLQWSDDNQADAGEFHIGRESRGSGDVGV